MLRYFKKYDTRVPVMTGQGFAIPFEAITDEKGQLFEYGVLATSDGYVIGELESFIRQQVGGVQEVSAQEFEAIKKKERLKLLPSWREVFSVRTIQRLYERWKDSTGAAGVSTGNDPSRVKGEQRESWKLSRPQTVSDWRPTAVSRL